MQRCRFHIDLMEFTDVRSGDKTRGCIIYNEYHSLVMRGWSSFPDDDLECLRKAYCLRFNNEQRIKLFDDMIKQEMGVFIGHRLYEWSEIEDILG